MNQQQHSPPVPASAGDPPPEPNSTGPRPQTISSEPSSGREQRTGRGSKVADPFRLIVHVNQSDLPKAQRVSVAFLRKLAGLAAREAGLQESAEMSLTLTDDARIRSLNAEYRGLDKATDVLSFAFEEAGPYQIAGLPRQIGDVIISIETTYRQAEEHGSTPEAELAWVVCHGTLHLLGFDHQDESQRDVMRRIEQLALDRAQLGHLVRLP